MKKLLFIALLCFTAVQVFSQSVVKLRGDTIEILKNQGNAELAIRNSTRDTAGFLLNVGNGATQFHAPHRVNDSTIQIGPITIIVQAPGVPPGTNSGDTIYIASAVDTFYTVPIGTAAGMIQTQYTISAPNFSEIRHSNWGPGLWTIPHLAPDSLAYIDIDSAALRAYLQIAAGGVIITADDGLTKNTATNIQLGGTFTKTNTEDVGNFNFNITGTGVTGGFVMDIINSSSGTALRVDNIAGGGALVAATVGSGYPGEFDLTNSSTNSTAKIMNFFRNVSGTAQAGMGANIGLQMKDAGNFIADAVILNYVWIDPAAASRTADLKITGAFLGATTNWLEINGGGTESFGTGFGFTSTHGAGGFNGIGTTSGGVFEGGIVAVQAENTSTSTNTSVKGIQMGRQGGAFNGAIGEGIKFQFDLHDGIGNDFNSGYIQNVLIDPTAGASATKIDFAVSIASVETITFSMKGGALPTYNTIVPVFANNAAALAGGLVAGDHYRNGDADNIAH